MSRNTLFLSCYIKRISFQCTNLPLLFPLKQYVIIRMVDSDFILVRVGWVRAGINTI